jgi:hypothetical protein
VANKRSAASKGAKRSKDTVAKKKAAKRSATKKSAAKKPPKSAKKAAGKAAKKPTAKKAATQPKAAAKKAAAKKAPASKKVPAKKAAAKKAGAVDKTPKKAGRAAKPKLRALSARKVGSASVPPASPSSKRNYGLRGAAPWVARHAAKHAEELRRRNAEPPPPGSARATLREPEGAAQIKSDVTLLHQYNTRVRNLRKKLDKSFFEMGVLLDEVQRQELYLAKGYSTFESFLDREIDLPRSVSLRLIRITHTFTEESAYDFGLDRLTSALAALDGEVMQATPSHPSSRGWSQPTLPPKPPLRFDD